MIGLSGSSQTDVQFLTEKVGMKDDDAAMLMTMTGDLIIYQTVNPTMTVRVGNFQNGLSETITQTFQFHNKNL